MAHHPASRRSSRRDSEALSRRPSIDPSRLVPMDKVFQLPGSDDFNVVFVGAGNIMFGSDEGPWNHSFRFEHKLGPRLKVVALIDPNIERASAVLFKKRETFVRSAYEHTRIFKTLEEFVKNMLPRDRPRAVIVGSPPMFRGTTHPGRDVELQILRHFPGVALFIEKPIATGPEDEIAEAFKVSQAIIDSAAVCSVGYMLRYLKGVQMIKQIIEENNLQVMATIARYACAYEAIAKPDWWDKSKRYCLCPITRGVILPSKAILSIKLESKKLWTCRRAGHPLLRPVTILWWRRRHFICHRPLPRVVREPGSPPQAVDRRNQDCPGEPHPACHVRDVEIRERRGRQLQPRCRAPRPQLFV